MSDQKFQKGDRVFFQLCKKNEFLPVVVKSVDEVNKLVEGTVYDEVGNPMATLVWNMRKVFKNIDQMI